MASKLITINHRRKSQHSLFYAKDRILIIFKLSQNFYKINGLYGPKLPRSRKVREDLEIVPSSISVLDINQSGLKFRRFLSKLSTDNN